MFKYLAVFRKGNKSEAYKIFFMYILCIFKIFFLKDLINFWRTYILISGNNMFLFFFFFWLGISPKNLYTFMSGRREETPNHAKLSLVAPVEIS